MPRGAASTGGYCRPRRRTGARRGQRDRRFAKGSRAEWLARLVFDTNGQRRPSIAVALNADKCYTLLNDFELTQRSAAVNHTIVVGAVFAALIAAPAAYALDGQNVGTLTCSLTGKTNAIVYTDETFTCGFDPVTGEDENYEGEIRSVGIDLSFTDKLTLVWAVVTTRTPADVPGLLSGTYMGAGADVQVGGGIGVNALVGGSDRQIGLQPISVEGLVGVGASVGIESFTLR